MPLTNQSAAPGEQVVRAQSYANTLLAEGKELDAAKYLLGVADEYPNPHSSELKLRAIDILFTSHNIINARLYLSRLLEDQLTPGQLIRKRLYQAQFMSQTKRPQEAIALLPLSLVDSAPKELRKQAYELLWEMALQTGDIVLGIESYTELHRLKEEPANGQQAEDLWKVLSRASPDLIKAYKDRSLSPRMRAWLELALIVTPEQVDWRKLESALSAWKNANTWAELPATIDEQIHKRWQYLDFNPQRVALLLPLTGEYAQFGRAIESGFMESLKSEQHTFTVRTYNTDQEQDITAIYKQAVTEGADFIVGPLISEHITRLVETRTISIPTLSLNYYRGDGHIPMRDYVQFGLLPEDEAIEVARRMWSDGKHRALLLAPNNAWGTRLADAFTNEYLRLGGSIQQTLRYNPALIDYSADIKEILKLDESSKRYKSVSRAVGGKLRYEPHIRRDINTIALFADAERSTLLYPQLRYHHAEVLPVYAPSHIYDPRRKILRELDDILYCDAPIIFNQTEAKKAKSNRAESNRDYARLYALGLDAANLIGVFRVMQIAKVTHQGHTGTLSLLPNKRIFRRLEWAQFKRSAPVRLPS